MKTSKKTMIYGLVFYSIGFFILIINGMSMINVFGNAFIFAGLFLLGVTFSLLLKESSSKKEEVKKQ